MDKSSRIYVAGHAGLIGSALLRRLKNDGFRNILSPTRAQLDLAQAAPVKAFFRKTKPEYVILAAGRVGGIIENKSKPADFILENLAIQLNVMGAARTSGVKRLIFFGSSCMYPRKCAQPMREEMLLTGPLEPTSMAYAAAKIAGVEMCLAFNRQDGGQRFVPLIPNSVYGPDDNFDPKSGHVLSALIRRFHDAKAKKRPSVTLWGSGKPRREFLYADDLAAACLRLLNADLSKTDLPINVGSGSDISIRELANLVKATVGYNGSVKWDRTKPDGAPAKWLDTTRLARLGWKSETPLDAGVRRTYQWYKTVCAKG